MSDKLRELGEAAIREGYHEYGEAILSLLSQLDKLIVERDYWHGATAGALEQKKALTTRLDHCRALYRDASKDPRSHTVAGILGALGAALSRAVDRQCTNNVLSDKFEYGVGGCALPYGHDGPCSATAPDRQDTEVPVGWMQCSCCGKDLWIADIGAVKSVLCIDCLPTDPDIAPDTRQLPMGKPEGILSLQQLQRITGWQCSIRRAPTAST